MKCRQPRRGDFLSPQQNHFIKEHHQDNNNHQHHHTQEQYQEEQQQHQSIEQHQKEEQHQEQQLQIATASFIETPCCCIAQWCQRRSTSKCNSLNNMELLMETIKRGRNLRRKLASTRLSSADFHFSFPQFFSFLIFHSLYIYKFFFSPFYFVFCCTIIHSFILSLYFLLWDFFYFFFCTIPLFNLRISSVAKYIYQSFLNSTNISR